MAQPVTTNEINIHTDALNLLASCGQPVIPPSGHVQFKLFTREWFLRHRLMHTDTDNMPPALTDGDTNTLWRFTSCNQQEQGTN